MVKKLPANAGDLRDARLIPGSGRSPGGGHGNPLQCSCLENPRDGSPVGCSLWGRTESDTSAVTQHGNAGGQWGRGERLHHGGDPPLLPSFSLGQPGIWRRVGVAGVAGLCTLTEGSNHPLRSSPPLPAGPWIEPWRGLGCPRVLATGPVPAMQGQLVEWGQPTGLPHVPSKPVSLHSAPTVCRALPVSPMLEDQNSSQMGRFP